MSAETVRALLAELDDRGLAELAERLAPHLTTVMTVRLLSAQEAAERLGVHPKTIARKCADGLIPSAVKVGTRWRIPEDALHEAQRPVPRKLSPAELTPRRRRARAQAGAMDRMRRIENA